MQIVENWTYLIGIIIGVLPSPDLPDFYQVEVRIEAMKPVESFPMLVQGSVNDTVVVLVRRSQVDDMHLTAGDPFSARVRAAGPPPLKYFVTPDWPPGE